MIIDKSMLLKRELEGEGVVQSVTIEGTHFGDWSDLYLVFPGEFYCSYMSIFKTVLTSVRCVLHLVLFFVIQSGSCLGPGDGKSMTAAHMRTTLLWAMWSYNVAYTVEAAVHQGRRHFSCHGLSKMNIILYAAIQLWLFSLKPTVLWWL